MIISGFLVRFMLFWLKIALSCVFIIALQVQVGPKSLEQWIEQGLKQSAFSRYLKRNARAGVRVMNQKLPVLRGLAQNKIVKNSSVVEFHSGLIRQMEGAFEEFENFEPSSTPSPGEPSPF